MGECKGLKEKRGVESESRITNGQKAKKMGAREIRETVTKEIANRAEEGQGKQAKINPREVIHKEFSARS